MKKLAAAVVIVLFTITVVYAQTDSKNMVSAAFTLKAQGNNLRIWAQSSGAFLVVDFQGKTNGKPIEFEEKGFGNFVMNDDGLSDEEHRMVEIGLDLITSVFNRGKFEMPEMSFELKVINEGDAFLATVKPRSGGSSFEGKLEGGVNGKRFEFKQDATGAVIVNNGTLSEGEVLVLEQATNMTKSILRLAHGKQ